MVDLGISRFCEISLKSIGENLLGKAFEMTNYAKIPQYFRIRKTKLTVLTLKKIYPTVHIHTDANNLNSVARS